MTVGTCAPWATTSDIAECSACSGVDTELLTDMLAVASDVLFELSGQRFSGVCSDTVRPCARRIQNDRPHYFTDFLAYNLGGFYPQGWNGGVCGCNDSRSCGCTQTSEITLGAWPIVGITEVLVDGVVLDPSRYRVDDSRYLVRLPNADGSRPGWPCCQDIALPSTEHDTFEVSFTYGQAPPAAGVLAASVLACELALACTGAECRLPRKVQSITRQGVAMTFVDPHAFLENGTTWLPEVDMFLATYGPGAKKRLPSAIVNPDIHRAVRRTGLPTSS